MTPVHDARLAQAPIPARGPAEAAQATAMRVVTPPAPTPRAAPAAARPGAASLAERGRRPAGPSAPAPREASRLLASAWLGTRAGFAPAGSVPAPQAAGTLVARAPIAPAGETTMLAALPSSADAAAVVEGAPAAVASAPRGIARAALEREVERELAVAVPTPALRPARRAPAAPAIVRRNRAPAALLAYARPDAGALGGGGGRSLMDRFPLTPAPGPAPAPAPAPKFGAGTAIYDIAASTVYLPNGERLEAHSGLGPMRDDVRYVRHRNRGPTPPHTYNLAMRESLFHGVEAIRLHPVGGASRIHNRVGLLAHTYLLGPRGDSNGCVSFKDYKRFLAAFKRGEIKRLVVVASLKKSSSLMSGLFRRR
ncbi:tlde1 domain-containing protein [Aurantimonas sp. Leaf443]|uniref:tlde1 domain-containing protein n=1 Tax=Aurantimonas sp. Leaf443 TaxID=1736378 RepID=UPI0009E76B07|nr:tlde1 domain-containing protein [Aurantimonas sp. Leaf443]